MMSRLHLAEKGINLFCEKRNWNIAVLSAGAALFWKHIRPFEVLTLFVEVFGHCFSVRIANLFYLFTRIFLKDFFLSEIC